MLSLLQNHPEVHARGLEHNRLTRFIACRLCCPTHMALPSPYPTAKDVVRAMHSTSPIVSFHSVVSLLYFFFFFFIFFTFHFFSPKSQEAVSKVTADKSPDLHIITISASFMQNLSHFCMQHDAGRCASHSAGDISPFTTMEFVHWEALICFPMDTDTRKDITPPSPLPPAAPNTWVRASQHQLQPLAYACPTASVEPHDRGSHILGRSSVLHQKVNHALRLDEQVAAQKEDAEHHSQGEDAEDGDLHHACDVQAALVGCQHRGAAVGCQHRAGPIAAGQEQPQTPGPVGVSSLLQEALVEERSIHGLRRVPIVGGRRDGAGGPPCCAHIPQAPCHLLTLCSQRLVWKGRKGVQRGATGCKLPPAAQHGHPSTEREGEGGMGQRKAAGGGRMLPALLPP